MTSSLHFCPQYIYQVLSGVKTCHNSIPFKWNPVKLLSLQSSLTHLFVIINKNTDLTTTVRFPHGQFHNQMQYHIVSPKFLWMNIFVILLTSWFIIILWLYSVKLCNSDAIQKILWQKVLQLLCNLWESWKYLTMEIWSYMVCDKQKHLGYKKWYIAKKISSMTTGTVMRLWPRFYRQQTVITMH